MCIRALDYCPPVDVTFGEFLRAIITADVDLVASDPRNYRLHFIDAFRRRGIYPQGINNLSVDSLCYSYGSFSGRQLSDPLQIIMNFLRDYRKEILYETNRKKIYNISKKYMGGDKNLSLHSRLTMKFQGSAEFEKLTGIVFSEGWDKLGIRTSGAHGNSPSFQVQNLRLISRVGPDGNQINQIIFSIIQRSGIISDENGNFTGHYQPNSNKPVPEGGFELWGGCTLIFDLDTLTLKYAIRKPLLDMALLEKEERQVDIRRVESQYRYQAGLMQGLSDHNLYFGHSFHDHILEPFAFLHQH